MSVSTCKVALRAQLGPVLHWRGKAAAEESRIQKKIEDRSVLTTEFTEEQRTEQRNHKERDERIRIRKRMPGKEYGVQCPEALRVFRHTWRRSSIDPMKTHAYPVQLAGMLMAALAVISGNASGRDEAKATPAPSIKPKAEDAAAEVRDLPIKVWPQGRESTDMLGIFITGDGGLWSLDKAVMQEMADHGVPMIGLSSYKYFAKPRTPDETAADMFRALRFYMKKWDKQRIVLVGYSLGAEIIPFVATRVPEDLLGKVAMVVMLGPSDETMFEYHIMDWLFSTKDRPKYSVIEEIRKIHGPKVLCVTSVLDRECICEELDPGQVTVLKRAGGHHYNNNYMRLTEAIMLELNKAADPAKPAVP